MEKRKLDNPLYGQLEDGKSIPIEKLLHKNGKYFSLRYSDTDITFGFPGKINREDWEGFCKELEELSKELLQEKIQHPTLTVVLDTIE